MPRRVRSCSMVASAIGTSMLGRSCRQIRRSSRPRSRTRAVPCSIRSSANGHVAFQFPYRIPPTNRSRGSALIDQSLTTAHVPWLHSGAGEPVVAELGAARALETLELTSRVCGRTHPPSWAPRGASFVTPDRSSPRAERARPPTPPASSEQDATLRADASSTSRDSIAYRGDAASGVDGHSRTLTP